MQSFIFPTFSPYSYLKMADIFPEIRTNNIPIL